MMPRFEYLKPHTAQEVTQILEEHGRDAVPFAGGTDLFVLMRDRVVRPKFLVDLKGIPELSSLDIYEDHIEICATKTLSEILKEPVVKEHFRALWQAIKGMADSILRNRATLVGNICNASPAADTAPPLLVLDARVDICTHKGMRTVPINTFFTGVKKTVLERGEWVKSVTIPFSDCLSSGYIRWGRVRGEDLSVVGVAAAMHKKNFKIALSSVSATPLLVPGIEGEYGTEETIKKAVSMVQKSINPISDVRASAEYRMHMAGVLTEELLRDLMGRR